MKTVPNEGVSENFAAFRIQLNSRFFMETIILICWTIWIAKNELIFKGNQMGLTDCRSYFFKEAKLVGLRVKERLYEEFNQWIQSLQAL